MALWSAMLHDHAGQPIQVDREQVHDRGFVGDQDQFLRTDRRHVLPRPQVLDDPAKDVFDVVKPFLKERVGEFLKGPHIFIKRLQQCTVGTGAALQARG